MSASAAGAPDRGGSRSAVTTRSPTASAAARREDPDPPTNHLRKPSAETQRARAPPEGAARDLHTARLTQPPGLPAPPPCSPAQLRSSESSATLGNHRRHRSVSL